MQIAAYMHILFEEVPDNIIAGNDDKSLLAAINFVDVCCQHTAYIAQRELDDVTVAEIDGIQENYQKQ